MDYHNLSSNPLSPQVFERFSKCSTSLSCSAASVLGWDPGSFLIFRFFHIYFVVCWQSHVHHLEDCLFFSPCSWQIDHSYLRRLSDSNFQHFPLYFYRLQRLESLNPPNIFNYSNLASNVLGIIPKTYASTLPRVRSDVLRLRHFFFFTFFYRVYWHNHVYESEILFYLIFIFLLWVESLDVNTAILFFIFSNSFYSLMIPFVYAVEFKLLARQFSFLL